MMKHYHFEIIAILFSALLHAAIAIPYLSGKWASAPSSQTTIPLKLAMFKTVPEPVQAITPEPAKPVPPPPKPVKPQPVVKKKLKPVEKPTPVIKPVVVEKPEPPEPEEEQPLEVVQATPTTHPASPAMETEPEQMMHDLGVIARLEDEYKLNLSKLIDANKQYPNRARRRNIEGKATVSFLVLRDGTVKQIRVIDSTGHQILDKAVIQAIQAVSGKLPLPEDLKRQQWQFKIPLSFSLS